MHTLYYSNGKIKYVGDAIPLDTTSIYKGKTYWKNGKLMYDGSYCNKHRHGDGIEYWTTGVLNYEGGWKNDKRHGYGQLYYETGELWYEGEWNLNMFCGTGTEYDKNGNIIYNGCWKNSLYNGKGMLYKDGIIRYEAMFVDGHVHGDLVKYNDKGSVVYQGEYVNGMMHGKGKIYSNNGIVLYDGMLMNNMKHGKGKEYSIYGVLMYEGEFVKNKKFGIGTRYVKGTFNDDGKYNGTIKTYNEQGYIIYNGECEKGLRHGHGIFTDEDGSVYTGEWCHGEKHGNGILMDSMKKKVFEGEYVKNIAHNGKWYSNKKLSYEGVNKGKGISYISYKKNKQLAEVNIYNDNGIKIYKGSYNIDTKQREGNGKAYDMNGTLIYEGNFENDMYNGYGVTYIVDNKISRPGYEYPILKFKGNFKNGLYHGYGKEYSDVYPNSKRTYNSIIYEGKYENGVRTNGREITYNNSGRKIKSIDYSHDKKMREENEANIKLGKRKKADEDMNTPVEFRCPISMELMHDPVVCSDGHTYDKESIDRMFKINKLISPMTREKINKIYTPNITLKKLINDYIEKMI